MNADKIAFLFPGQGSQSPGMGRELAAAFPESREVFEAADRALEMSMSGLCFEGSAEELALTENTQPSILTCSIAVLRVLEAHGIRAVAAAGHSLGEYSAHVAAGTLRFEDAVRTVRRRGRFMQQAVPVGEGSMAAVLGMTAEEVIEICRRAAEGQIVGPANLNGPSQVVIAGHASAVDRASAAAREAGARKVVPLKVSAPFHCALMEPAAEQLRPVLESIEFSDPSFPVYSNVDAVPVASGEAAREALVRQVASPVRWKESVEAMLAAGCKTFIEVGPGKVLAGLMRSIDRSATVHAAGDPAAIAALLEKVGERTT